MRRIINDPTYMTYNEMEEKFIGKWILITNCDYSPYQELLGGIPVAVADSVFEGQSDGFYDKFKAPQYAPRADRDFDYESVPGLLGLYNSITWVDEGDDVIRI